MPLHAKDCIQQCMKRICIQTGDTYVVAFAVSVVDKLAAKGVWVAFCTGRLFRYIEAHSLASCLVQELMPYQSSILWRDVIPFHLLLEYVRLKLGTHGWHIPLWHLSFWKSLHSMLFQMICPPNWQYLLFSCIRKTVAQQTWMKPGRECFPKGAKAWKTFCRYQMLSISISAGSLLGWPHLKPVSGERPSHS